MWLHLAAGPVTVAFTVYSDFEAYAGGVYVKTPGAQARLSTTRILGCFSQGPSETRMRYAASSTTRIL